MTEKREKLQVYKNNWARRIAGVKRIDKRRMEELREEAGVRESHKEAGGSLTRKLVRSRLKWACGKNGSGTIDEESWCA